MALYYYSIDTWTDEPTRLNTVFPGRMSLARALAPPCSVASGGGRQSARDAGYGRRTADRAAAYGRRSLSDCLSTHFDAARSLADRRRIRRRARSTHASPGR